MNGLVSVDVTEPDSWQPEQPRRSVLSHSWPLCCRLESTASVEGPRASPRDAQPHYNIVSFPLKFEKPENQSHSNRALISSPVSPSNRHAATDRARACTSRPTLAGSDSTGTSRNCRLYQPRHHASAGSPRQLASEVPALKRAPPYRLASSSLNTVQLGLHGCSLAVCRVLGGRSRSRIVACRTWCRSVC